MSRGECHLHPPVPADGCPGKHESHFPRIAAENFCGDWKPARRQVAWSESSWGVGRLLDGDRGTEEKHNACTEPCDNPNGPCACGAWHKDGV